MGAPRPRTVVLDAGALIQFDRGHPRMRALIRLALDRSSPLIVPAGVLGQVWRDGSRQVPLVALLSARITTVESLDEPIDNPQRARKRRESEPQGKPINNRIS